MPKRIPDVDGREVDGWAQAGNCVTNAGQSEGVRNRLIGEFSEIYAQAENCGVLLLGHNNACSPRRAGRFDDTKGEEGLNLHICLPLLLCFETAEWLLVRAKAFNELNAVLDERGEAQVVLVLGKSSDLPSQNSSEGVHVVGGQHLCQVINLRQVMDIEDSFPSS